MRKIILLALCIVMALCCFTACGSSIVGKWKCAEYSRDGKLRKCDITYEFKDDETLIATNNQDGQTITGTYSVKDDTLYANAFQGSGSVHIDKLESNELVLRKSGEHTTIYYLTR